MSVKLLSLANLGVFLKIEGEFLTVVSGTAPEALQAIGLLLCAFRATSMHGAIGSTM
jgi:hypothetical protein